MSDEHYEAPPESEPPADEEPRKGHVTPRKLDGTKKVYSELDRAENRAGIVPSANGNGNGNGELTHVATAYRFDELKPRNVDWLWHPYLARGKLSMFDGDPGLGKSAIALDLAARISAGKPWPGEGEHVQHPRQAVLYMSAEDDYEDTILPRFIEAGGTQGFAYFLRVRNVANGVEGLPSFPRDYEELERRIIEHDVKFAVVDVLVAFLDGKVQTHNDHEVRQALTMLVEIAARTGCTIVLLRHLNKSSGGNIMYRGGGSIAFSGIVRMALVVGIDPDNDELRVFGQYKNNLAERGGSFGYVIRNGTQYDTARVSWLGESKYKAEEFVDARSTENERPERITKKRRCMEWLAELLADGPMPAKWILNRGDAEGYGKSTVHDARAEWAEHVVIDGGHRGKEATWRWVD